MPARRSIRCEPASTSPVVRSMKVCQLTQHVFCRVGRDVVAGLHGRDPAVAAHHDVSLELRAERREVDVELLDHRPGVDVDDRHAGRLGIVRRPSDGRSVIIRIVRVPGMSVPEARTPSTNTSRETRPPAATRLPRSADRARESSGQRRCISAARRAATSRSDARSESDVAASASMRWFSAAAAASRP